MKRQKIAICWFVLCVVALGCGSEANEYTSTFSAGGSTIGGSDATSSTDGGSPPLGGGGSGGFGGAGGDEASPCAGYFHSDAIWCQSVENQPLAPQSAEATAATGDWGMGKFQIDFSIVLTTLDENNPGAMKTFQETGDLFFPD